MLVAALGLASCGTEPADQGVAQGSGAPKPRVVATIEVGRMHAISAGAGGLWTANYEQGTVSMVDPSLNDVVQTIHVEDELGSGASDVHALDRHVWLSASDSGTVGHLDPTTLEVTAAADADSASIIDMAAAPTEVWLAQYSGMRFAEPVTAHGSEIKSANAQVPPPGEKYSIYSDIAAGDAGVWALDESQGTLAAISPTQGDARVATTGESLFKGAQADIAVGHGDVWVETSDAATSGLARFDPTTSKIDSISVNGQDGVMAVGPDALWLLTHEDERGFLWRIDPDTLAHDPEPFTIDGEFQAGDISYGLGSVWVSHDTNLLTRIDVTGGQAPTEPVPSPEARGDAEVCDQTGPWVYCPEAQWLRRVVVEAGVEVTGDTGSALQVVTESHSLYAWNTDAPRSVEEVASEGGYERREGTEAFTDGSRILWEAQGLHIYLSSADEKSIDSLPDDVIENLIDASNVMPMAADLTGAKPQPTPTGDRRSEETEGERVRVWPVTEDVENEGKYLFTAPHCGIDWMIDFDASFWNAVKPDDYGNGDNYPFFYNSDEGAITFTGADTAVYQASTGEKIQLNRLSGPITIDPCA
jgi:streptogramin lyase